MSRLTDTSIRAFLADSEKEWMPVDSRRVEFRANTKRTGGTFYDVVYQGKLKKRTVLGKWPAILAVDLFKRLSKIRTEVMAGERTGARADSIGDVGVMLLWFLDHIEQDKSFSTRYAENAYSFIHTHLMGCFEGLPVKKLTRNAVYKRFYKVKLDSLALSSIRTIWGVLKRACSLAAEYEVIESNPLRDVLWKNLSSTKEKVKSGRLKVHHLSRVADHINDEQANRRLFFIMQLCHGTRIHETCLVEWSHISLDTAEWYIPAENTKTGVELRLPLAPCVVELLRHAKARANGAYVFSCTGKSPVADSTASSWYKALRKRVGVYFTSHDFRKLADDWWMHEGIDSTVRKMLINHSRGNLEGRYESQYAWPIMTKAVRSLSGEVVL
ncbi:tyrosine-type recombinase/integrase [Marinomonas transparens]|uniref:Tyrosine-type recombinase/integrase n=1 Tax=Marinomonas transparens TaxID=2795388 RepID=A0A934N8A3_9GAMM|nr:site-specific integrase [Marinomonas transparens]MBJ7539876.1 tyrosine-type recombinase/integrase [Marinomonas transparens]